jgi:DNA-binding HxlR family transcriptional regulator
MACSIARSLDVVGEPWTPLIIRDLWLGRNKFDDLQRNLKISRKVLTQRLHTLLEEGVVERKSYQLDPERFEYLLTEKGQELLNVLLALMAWGDRWADTGDGPPMIIRHKACGKRTRAAVTCSCCGEPLSADDIGIVPGPGARDGWGTPWGKLPPRTGTATSRQQTKPASGTSSRASQ